MKKWNLWLLASLFAAVFTLAACGDDDDEDVTPPPGNGASVGDLEGTWKSPIAEDLYGGKVYNPDSLWVRATYEFQGNMLRISYSENVGDYYGTFTLKDGEITFGKQVYGKQVTVKAKVIMLYGKQALVLKIKPENGEESMVDEVTEVLFKNGVAPKTLVTDIQGKWFWYMNGNKDEVRAAMIIKDNNFEMIIGAWGQKYTGTFTYQGGVMKLNITNGFTSREPGTGYGSGYGNLDPATLEGTWNELNKEHWTMQDGMQTFFIAATTEAYGEIAGLPAVFYKQ